MKTPPTPATCRWTTRLVATALAAMALLVTVSACDPRQATGAHPSVPPAGSNQSASSPVVVQSPPAVTNSQGGAVPATPAAPAASR